MRQKGYDYSVVRKERRDLLKKLNGYPHGITPKGAIRWWCGDMIGSGLNRDVYVLKLNPDWVVKIQKTINFDNIVEFLVWDHVRFAPSYNKWFAECLTITESGLILIQKRITHKHISLYPKKVPNYFTDFKIANYGWIGNQFVCCDYASVLAMSIGKLNNKKRVAKWWIDDGKANKRRPKQITLK